MMMQSSLLAFFVFGVMSAEPVLSLADVKNSITLRRAGVEKNLTLPQLKKKLKTFPVTVEDPVYKKQKTYLAFELKEVLKLVSVDQESEADEILFTCADGYQPTLDLKLLSQGEGYLAYAEKAVAGGWTRFKQGKTWMTPAPFYLVWKGTGAASNPALPWPYQVVVMELVRFKEKFAHLYPLGAEVSSPEFGGFLTFKSECMRCHSINLQGGDLGPELNIPKNITEYRDEKTLREFIRDAGKFRAKSKMPAFPGLTDEKLDEVLKYLRVMKDYQLPAKLIIPNS